MSLPCYTETTAIVSPSIVMGRATLSAIMFVQRFQSRTDLSDDRSTASRGLAVWGVATSHPVDSDAFGSRSTGGALRSDSTADSSPSSFSSTNFGTGRNRVLIGVNG